MLAYVARSINGLNGADQLVPDVLAGLLSTGRPVTVLSNSRLPLAALPRDPVTPPIRWLSPPAELTLPTSIDRRLPGRVARWLKWSALDLRARRRLGALRPALTLVHSGASHSSRWLDDLGAGARALIVHESPRHFGGMHQKWNVDEALAVMNCYSHLIFVSLRCQQEWQTIGGLWDKPTFYVPNCCREDAVWRLLTEDRAQVRQRLSMSPDRFVAVCVASVQHRKGQDILIDNFADLLDAAPDLELYLVGDVAFKREWGAELQRRVAERGFAGRVRFMGPRHDALDFIYAADVLLLPSRAEAMPLVVLEAMALGTPVIASSVDGVPELVNHGSTGLLFDPADPAGLTEALAAVAGDRELGMALARGGVARYWEHFSRAHLIRRYADVCEEILTGAAPQMRPQLEVVVG
jgi:glycosyltransferase involved in cell wall biosynthesis